MFHARQLCPLLSCACSVFAYFFPGPGSAFNHSRDADVLRKAVCRTAAKPAAQPQDVVCCPGLPHMAQSARGRQVVQYSCAAAGGRMGMSLADKVRQVEATSPLVTTISPPHTNTRHGSVTGENHLMPISEEHQEDSALDSRQASNPGVPAAAEEVVEEAAPQPAAPEDADTGSLAVQRAPSAGAELPEQHQMPLTQRPSLARSDVSVASRVSHAELHTSKVGSWMYMAPEMVTSHQYTEKVDVFSIGVMLFEALRGRLNVTKLAVTHDPGSLQDYADSVADGFREDIPSNWPEEVASLIRDSWHQDPDMRITAAEFLTRVSNLMNSDIPQVMDDVRKSTIYTGDCSCCSIM
eukprot:jgi/Ulvmu1/12031/UM083_0044.1